MPLACRRVLWVSKDAPTTSLGLTYHQIIIHAISKDTEAHPRACVYLQLDEGSEDMMPGHDDDDNEEEQDQPAAEVRLVPEDDTKGVSNCCWLQLARGLCNLQCAAGPCGATLLTAILKVMVYCIASEVTTTS